MARNPRYDNLGGSGDRTASITIASTLSVASGTLNNLIDGGYTANTTDAITVTGSQLSKEISFDFGVGNSKKITGFIMAFNAVNDPTTWKLQASTNNVSYVDITGDSVNLDVSNGRVKRAESTGTNDGPYRYYKLVQTSSSTSSVPFWLEIEFRIIDNSTADDKAAVAASYSNYLGSGRRTGKIVFTSTFTWAGGIPDNILDGTGSNTAWLGASQTSGYLEFDFKTPVVITEFTWTQSGAGSQGSFKWQKWDGASWVDVGSPFTLGATTSTVVTAMSAETDYCTKFRITKTTGATTSSPYVTSITFKIGYPEVGVPSSGITSITPNSGPASGGTAVTIAGLGFTGATGATIGGSAIGSFTVVSDTSITGTTPAKSEGVYDVVVQRPAGDLTLVNGFEYGTTARVTQLPVMVLDAGSRPVRVTQLPVMVLDAGARPVRVSQLAIMALALPRQPTRVTQIPVHVSNLPKPLPVPGPILPEVPVTEIWSWKTVVNIADKGVEQRSAIRANPRVSMEFDGVIFGSIDRLAVYQMLFDYIKKTFSYPLYMHSTKLTAVTSSGTAKLYFDPAATDMRAGEAIALYDRYLEKTDLATILTVDADGATLTANVSADIPAHILVCPVSTFAMRQSVGLEMSTTAGEFSLKIDGATQRSVLRPNQASDLLTLVDGLLVLDKPILSEPGADEKMDQDVTWLDNDISSPQPRTLWRVPFINGTRQYVAHRPFGLDYWRAVGNYLKGRQKAFLLPTFFDDIPLAEQPALSATTIKSTNVIFFGFWRSKVYRYIRIHSNAGVIYRRILEVTANYDAVTQEPVTIDIKLSASIGGGAGANVIKAISFCYTTRLDSDDIVFEHYEVDSIVKLKIRTIEE